MKLTAVTNMLTTVNRDMLCLNFTCHFSGYETSV